LTELKFNDKKTTPGYFYKKSGQKEEQSSVTDSFVHLTSFCPKKEEEILSLFRSRNFIFLCSANLVSQFGDRITHMALITLVGELNPHSHFAFSKMAIFFTLPVILFAPLAGIITDRFPRRRVLLFSDFTRALLIALVPLLLYLSKNQLLFIYPIIFLVFSLGIFFNVAKVSFVPQIVQRENLLLANSSLNFIMRFATVAGMLLGGHLLDWVGWNRGFYLDALTYLFSFGCLFFILSPHPTSSSPSSSFSLLHYRRAWRELKEACSLVVHNRLLLSTMLTIILFGLAASSTYVVLVPKIQQELKEGTGGVGIAGGMVAAGMIAGAFLMGIFNRKIAKKTILIVSLFILGLMFLLALGRISFLLINLVAAIGGVMSSAILITVETYLQELVIDKSRGKIVSFKEILMALSFLGFALLIGGIAELGGGKLALVVVGGILTFSSLFFSLWLRSN
jgi:MFS family permease